MNQLQRSAIATERQALFVHQSLRLGLLADAPGGSLEQIKIPKLMSPWASAKHKGSPFDFLGDAAKGIYDLLKGGVSEAYGTIKGMADGVVTLTALTLYETVPGVAKLIPGATKKAKDFEAGFMYALKHPEETLEHIGKEAISYDLWKEGHYAEAVGHDVVFFAQIFIGMSAVIDTSRTLEVASKSERATAALASVRRSTVQALEKDVSVLRRGEGADGATMAKVRHNLAEQDHMRATSKLEQSQAAHDKAIHEYNKAHQKVDVLKIGQAGSDVMHDDQKAKAQKP
jgi:hypothetical protein